MINYYVSENYGRGRRIRQTILIADRHALFAEKHRLKRRLWQIDQHISEIESMER